MEKDKLKSNGDPKRTKLPANLVTKAKELHTIRYPFKPEELAEKSKQMASAVDEKNRLADDLKTIKSEHKAKTDAKDAIINLMSSHINNGYEMKNVECEVEKDYEKGVKTYFYNGVKYDTVPLSNMDRQTELALINRSSAATEKDSEALDQEVKEEKDSDKGVMFPNTIPGTIVKKPEPETAIEEEAEAETEE